MRLLDQVASATQPIAVHQDDGTQVFLPGPETIAPTVRSSPLRYVLSQQVSALTSQIAREPDGLLTSCWDIIRVPAPLLWVEFDHAGRQRFGFLIECHSAKGRAGSIRHIWQNVKGLGPEMNPLIFDFDFDEPAPCRENGGKLPLEYEPECAHLEPLFHRFRPRPEPTWEKYYREHSANQRQYEAAQRDNLTMAFGDLPLLAALLLLTMAERALRRQPVAFAKLNRTRARSGKTPLLDHVELRLDLSAAAAPAPRGKLDGARQSPRLHLVRGHLVRRGDCIHWRSPHLRGDVECGAIKSRTVAVRV